MSALNLAQLSPLQVHQMVFIYNAVMNGWKVCRLEDSGNFKFKKRLKNAEDRKAAQQDGFLQRFLHNMQKLNLTTRQVQSFELSPNEDISI